MINKIPQTTLETLTHFFRTTYQLIRITYDAAPRILIVTILVRVLQSITPAIMAYLLKLIFDRLGLVLAGETVLSFQTDILPLLLMIGGLLTLSQSLTAFDIYIHIELGRRLELHISQLVYRQLLRFQGLAYFESPEFHDTLEQIAGHVRGMPVQLIRGISTLMGNVVTLISFFGVILVFSPLLSVVLVVAVVPAFITQLKFRRRRFEINWDNSPKKRKSWYFHRLLTQNHFAKEVRLFSLGDYLLNKYVDATEDVNQAHREIDQKELATNTILNLLSAMVAVGAYIFIIAQAFARQITLGDVTLFIEAVRNVQAQLNSIAVNLVNISQHALFFTHYQNLMAFEPDITILEPQQTIQPLQNEIRFDGVWFRYDDHSDYVLKDINFSIKHDESLALVGLNGAGKTTIVKLLSRFYEPTKGRILWDGVDIRHFDPSEYRNYIGAVLQDFIKYDVSARENIGLGDATYIEDLDRIQSAAREVGVHDFIAGLSQQYETVLSRWLVEKDERGTDLSGGQWQKIGISRTYLRNVNLLMLDEPTSALDAEAEYDIYQRFAEISRNRATILISHRFSTVRMADRIAVIQDGTIVEYGAHQDLLSANGTYAHLYSLQAQQYT